MRRSKLWETIKTFADLGNVFRRAPDGFGNRDTAVSRSDEYAGLTQVSTFTSRIRAIAFYLPQFHPIPENDRWWGKGFTEWTNVTRAVPQFEGHYQPHLPGELGFYDLRIPEVQKRQIELARAHGIHGFCYYYYWFSGTKLLTMPIDRHLTDKAMEFPFCLCWANENWTRRWDGLESDVLIAQRYEPDDAKRFFEDIGPYLADSRYIRIDGRPVVLVYRVDQIPHIKQVVDVWRKASASAGLGDPYLVAVRSFGITDPRPFGFDAAVEFPPHRVAAQPPTEPLRLLNARYAGNVYSYESIIPERIEWPEYTMFRTVMPSWDNEARRPARGHSFVGATPSTYRQWLRRVCEATDEHFTSEDQKCVFINAWNEWAEGAHLEPDQRFGFAYLQATREVLSDYLRSTQDRIRATQKSQSFQADTAVVVSLFYEDLWPELGSAIERVGECDVYVLTRPSLSRNTLDSILRQFPHAQIFTFPNRGRDIGGFLELANTIDLCAYKVVCKIHSKKSPHLPNGALWRRDMVKKLLGSHEEIMAIRQAFEDRPALGMIGPYGHFVCGSTYWGSNQQMVRALGARMGIVPFPESFSFFAGSMFWFRPQAFRALFALRLRLADFENEAGQVDGTLAHAVERMFSIVAEHEGFEIAETASQGRERSGADEPYDFVPR